MSAAVGDELAPKLQSDLQQTEDKFTEGTKQLSELQESREELLSRVESLKKDLQDWRVKLDTQIVFLRSSVPAVRATQVDTYKSELGKLRTALNDEVEELRSEFQGLRATLRKQLEATAVTGAVELSQEGLGDQAQ
eukprot:scaffold650_cov407-Prasinococcus_capsulatus_cf.AAC.7